VPIGITGQIWDFSSSEQPYELILRTDTTNQFPAPDGAAFPYASFAEEDTLAGTNVMGWRYYGLANAGRVFYGLDTPLPFVSPQVVFSTPCVDIPETVQFSQTWTTNFYWLTTYAQLVAFSNNLSISAVVDGWGTLLLPQLGPVPTLRIHQTDCFSVSQLGEPSWLCDVQTNHYYYWLVPNLGVAAEVIILGVNTLTNVALPFTNTVRRVYFANYYTNNAYGVVVYPSPANLSLQNAGQAMFLHWNGFGNLTNYRVDANHSLSGTNWVPLGYTSSTSWTDTIDYSQTFYRVVSVP